MFKGDVVSSVPHVSRLDVTPDVEFITVASDGVWDAMQPRELNRRVRNMLRKGRTPAEAVQKLHYQLRGAQDNTAFVLVDLLGPEGAAYWQEQKKKGGVFGRW